MSRSPESAPRDSQLVLKLGDIMYVPHYRNKTIYVGPGYPRLNQNRFSKDDLLTAGAKYVEKLLWVRGEHGVVTSANP
jgi:hypothetical protein